MDLAARYGGVQQDDEALYEAKAAGRECVVVMETDACIPIQAIGE